jgi:nitric oxide reductase large subunit
LIIFVLLTSLVLAIWLFVKATHKHRKYTQISPYHPSNQQTYCILSIYLVKAVQALMVVSALFISMSIFMIALGDSYQGLFVEQNLIECSPSQASDSKWFKDQKPLSMIQIFFDIA